MRIKNGQGYPRLGKIYEALNKSSSIKEAANLLGISEYSLREGLIYHSILRDNYNSMLIIIGKADRNDPISYKETPGKIHNFEERFIELKQYRVDNYIPTVGDYFLPNGQKV